MFINMQPPEKESWRSIAIKVLLWAAKCGITAGLILTLIFTVEHCAHVQF